MYSKDYVQNRTNASDNTQLAVPVVSATLLLGVQGLGLGLGFRA